MDFRHRLEVPKPLLVAAGALVVGMLLALVTESKWFDTHHLIEKWLCLAGDGLFASAVLLVLLQFPAISNEIEGYFISAFSNPSFVKTFNPEQLSALVRSIVKARYEPTPDEGYADAAIDLMDNFSRPYVASHTESIRLRHAGKKIVKRIVRNCSISLRHLREKEMTLLQLLRQHVLSSRVWFENTDDEREFESLRVRINGNAVLDLGKAELQQIEGLFRKEISAGPQFSYVSIAEWDRLQAAAGDLEGIRLRRSDLVCIDTAETRITGVSGATFSHRFRHLTHAPTISVHVDGASPCTRVRGFMYGNGLHRDRISVIDAPDAIAITTHEWLYPGCGYTIVVDETGVETTGEEACTEKKKNSQR
jgi:hypothetical protein